MSPIMTDERLDRSLESLCPPLPFTDDVEARIRSRAGLPAREVGAPPPRRPRGRRLAVAAAVVVAAGAGVVAQPVLGDLTPRASAAAVLNLEKAAAFVEGTPDAMPGPGQYLFVGSHDSSLASATTDTGKPLTAVVDTTVQVWIPAERSQEWLKRSESEPPTRWLIGSAELARAEGDGGLLDPEASELREARAACGDFPGWSTLGGEPGGSGCRAAGDWGQVTPRFVAELPTDPRGLYERMLADTGTRDPRDVLELAASLLRSGQATREVRMTVYRALMLVPGMTVTDGAANLAGQTGVGLGVAQGTVRAEVVVDPETGRYLGDRVVLNEPGSGMWQGLPAGTVVSSSAVTTLIADTLGSVPD